MRSTLKASMSAGVGHLRLRRLRWRLRGAWQWPLFGLFLVLDTALLHFLPVAGEGYSPIAALLLAGFINLAVVGVLAPIGGHLLRWVRPDLPRMVSGDYAGAALVVVTGVSLLALGVAHHPAVAAARQAFRAQSDAVRLYVLTSAPAVYRGNLTRADSWKLDDNLYRTCVPGRTSMDSLCLFVDTSQSPAGLRRDPNPAPNSRYFGQRVLRSSR
jgi:hypothetical protein